MFFKPTLPVNKSKFVLLEKNSNLIETYVLGSGGNFSPWIDRVNLFNKCKKQCFSPKINNSTTSKWDSHSSCFSLSLHGTDQNKTLQLTGTHCFCQYVERRRKFFYRKQRFLSCGYNCNGAFVVQNYQLLLWKIVLS